MNCHHAKAHRWANHHRNHGSFRSRKRRAKWARMKAAWAYPPANVQEFDDRYELLLYAPGFSKSDFKVALENDIIIIHAEQEGKAPQNASWRRREFSAQNFERRFELNEKIDRDKISAAYKDGILQISLLKLEDFYTTRKHINID